MPPSNPKLAPHQAVYGINVYLILEDQNTQKYPVVSVSIEYALNQIPVANVVLPAGKKISNDSELNINNLNIDRRIKAKLVLSGEGKPHPAILTSNPSPSGNVTDLVIFEGYVGAVHYQFNTNSVSSTVVLFHWMHDLDISTVASGDFMKTAPSDWFRAEFRDSTVNNTETFIYRLSGKQSSGGEKFLTTAQILDLDWWEGIFKPGLYYKATQPLTRFIKASTSSRAPNQFLLNVLDRLKSENRLRLNNRAKSALQSNAPTLRQLGSLFTEVIMEGSGGSSAFEKLVSLSREFKFVLAPRVSDCILKEYNPAGRIRKVLTVNDFDFGGSSPSPTVLPAAALLFGLPSQNLTVYSSNAGKRVDNGFVGQFPNPIPTQGIATGPFLVIPTPAWMHPIASVAEFSPKTGITVLPDTAKPPASSNSNADTQISRRDFRIFADAYAQSAYYDNLFASKTQDIVCGFRTDIELGDCILLKFNEQNKFFEKRGIVNSINHIFSAGESPRVNTIIRLKHVFDGSDISYFGLNVGLDHAFFVGK
jgi:hypothetical protein